MSTLYCSQGAHGTGSTGKALTTSSKECNSSSIRSNTTTNTSSTGPVSAVAAGAQQQPIHQIQQLTSEYTVHHQPPLRSHVNLLHQNSELSITANTEAIPMQQAAAATPTDYFRPYLHNNPYHLPVAPPLPVPPGATSSSVVTGPVVGSPALHGASHMTSMAPHPVASMHPHSHYAASSHFNAVHHAAVTSGSRLASDPAAAMAAAAAVSAAAASLAANNNSPSYKGYQDLYANNNPVTAMELSTSETTSPASGATTSDQQYNNNNNNSGPAGPRMFPARPQPTRPLMVGGSPKPPKDNSMQPPPSSPVHNNNNNNNTVSLTPPPTVVTHHRSQQQKSSGNSNLGSSAALYRDKLGLNSPSSGGAGTPGPHGGNSTPPSNNPAIPPVSPADGTNNATAAMRRLSGNSGASSITNNPKFRYPSGPSSSSSPPPPATPSSAMSSREGTPLPPSQRPEDAAPNVDISRVQITEGSGGGSDPAGVKQEEQCVKREFDSVKREFGGVKCESDQHMATPMSHQQQQQHPPGQPQGQAVAAAAAAAAAASATSAQQQHQFGGYSPTVATSPSPSTFSAQYSYLAQQHQQHHSQMGWQPHYPYSSPLDGTNNNLMAVRSLSDGLRSPAAAASTAAAAMGGAMGGYGSSYTDHQQYQYGTTIHHYGDPSSAQHSVMASAAGSVVSRTPGSAGTTGVLGSRGRGHHHSGSGNGVKIGRRPAHLPKVLKFHDKSLPPGWVRKLKCRKHGKQAGRWDVYIYSPCGVKFASKKKLKNFFEKNQLNYDIDEFDFTPYGRHTDNGASGRTGPNPGGSASSTSSTSGVATSGSTPGAGAGRHNSSGSTGSEGTHTGGSPASLHNYSPTHHHALHSSISSTPTSSSTYMPQSMMTPGSTSSIYGSPMSAVVAASSASAAAEAISASRSAAVAAVAVSTAVGGPPSAPTGPPGSEYSSFSAFDPLMENPPNASVHDLPPTSASSSAVTAAAVAAAVGGSTDFSTASSLVASASALGSFGVKPDSSSEYFPAEMAEILGSNPAVNSSLSNGLTGSAFGPPHGLSGASVPHHMSDPYTDLSRSIHHAGSLHPLSNASLESRGSTEDEPDDGLNRGSDNSKVSGLSKAFRALNDFNSVYSFE